MTVTSWIRSNTWPDDFYNLLGRSRFDPSTKELLATIRQANRQLLPYQNHANEAIRNRALKLLRELGRAEDTFSNPARRTTYDGQLAQRLIEEFQALSKEFQEGIASVIPQFPDWLIQQKQVHPDGVALVLDALPPKLRRRLPSSKAQTKTAVLDASEVFVDLDEEARLEPEPWPVLVPDWEDEMTVKDAFDPDEFLFPEPWIEPSPPDGRHFLLKTGAIGGGLFALVLGMYLWLGVDRDIPNAVLELVVQGPVATVLIDLEPITLGTDNQARIELAPGPYRVQVTWPNGDLTEESIVLEPGTHRQLEFVSASKPFEVREPGGLVLLTSGRPETLDAYREGTSRMKSGRWAEAREHFSQALRLEPRFWPALLARGECSLRLGEFSAARIDCAAARLAEPRSANALVHLGDACLESGDVASARNHFETAIQAHPRLAEAHAGAALADFYEGDFDLAVSACGEALQLDSTCVRAYLVRAAAYLETDRSQQAISDCTEALWHDPQALLSYAIRAEASRGSGLDFNVLANTQRARSLVGVTAIEQYYRARIYTIDNDPEQARDLLDQVLQRIPGLIIALRDRSELHIADGRNDLALADLTTALQQQPDLHMLLATRATLWLVQGDLNRALEDADRAVQEQPLVWECWFVRGLVCIRRNAFEDAILDFEQASNLRPSNAQTILLSGYCEFRRGNYTEAVDAHIRVIELDSDFIHLPVHEAFDPVPMGDPSITELGNAYRRRALEYMNKGENERARWAFDEARRINFN